MAWRLDSIGADGSGTEYVGDVYEPEEKAPTADSKTKIELFKKENGQTVFRSGKEKNKRENWKVVCADGGSDVNQAAVPGYSIGGNYPDGSGTGIISETDKKSTKQYSWSDWYGSSWGGWLNGMFGGSGSGSKELDQSKMVKVEIAGRTSGLPGSATNKLEFEPAQIWRRRLTWGLGWWRTELVPTVGTSRMGANGLSRTGLGPAIEKYAGRAHDEHVTVMGTTRAPVTRQVIWKKKSDGTYEVQTVEVLDQAKGATLKTEAENKKTEGGEWTVTGPTEINGPNSTKIKQETIKKTNGTGNDPSYVIQTEPNEVERKYREKEGSGKATENPQVTTVLKVKKDKEGKQTVTVERTSTEWFDSGEYKGGWSPFEVRQIKKGNSGGFELKSSIQGKWQKIGENLSVEKGGDNWIESASDSADNDRSESNWINI